MTSHGLADEQLISAVKKSGGRWDQILVDLKTHHEEIENQLNNNRMQAFALGLKGTPAYLIGPLLIRGGATKGEFQRTIKEARLLLS